jgi:hypothetical protein
MTSTLLPQNFRSLGQSTVFILTLGPNFVLMLITLPAYERWGAWSFGPIFMLPGFLKK